MKGKSSSTKKKKKTRKHKRARDGAKIPAVKETAPQNDSLEQRAIKERSRKYDTMKKAFGMDEGSAVPFPLLALPAELRIAIYELVLHRGTIAFPPKRLDRRKYPAQRRNFVQPALCKVAKQLRAETLPIFYGINSFEVLTYGVLGGSRFDYYLEREWDEQYVSSIMTWLGGIGPLNRSFIKTFVIKVEYDEDYASDPLEEELLEWLDNVQSTQRSKLSAYLFSHSIEALWLDRHEVDGEL